jgi:heme a synthase
MRGPVEHSVWRFRLAVFTAFATFPLIFIGGLVTSKDAGMAVPDWPSTFGYNMFTFPWSKMVGGVFYEHGHRLIGSFVGFLTMTLCFWTAFADKRAWLRRLTWLALAAVIVQGVMGGLRVTLTRSETFSEYTIVFAMVHGCFAQAYFVLISLIALFHSKRWTLGRPMVKEGSLGFSKMDLTRLVKLTTLMIGVIYLQLILGGIVRHTNQGVTVHMAFASLVFVGILWVFIRSAQRFTKVTRIHSLAKLLMVFLFAQIALGIGSWLALPGMAYVDSTSSLYFLMPTMHQALGAVILVSMVFLSVRARRLVVVADDQASITADHSAPRVVVGSSS